MVVVDSDVVAVVVASDVVEASVVNVSSSSIISVEDWIFSSAITVDAKKTTNNFN